MDIKVLLIVALRRVQGLAAKESEAQQTVKGLYVGLELHCIEVNLPHIAANFLHDGRSIYMPSQILLPERQQVLSRVFRELNGFNTFPHFYPALTLYTHGLLYNLHAG